MLIHSIIPYTVNGREICLIPSEWRIAIYMFIQHCIGSIPPIYSTRHISGLADFRMGSHRDSHIPTSSNMVVSFEMLDGISSAENQLRFGVFLSQS